MNQADDQVNKQVCDSIHKQADVPHLSQIRDQVLQRIWAKVELHAYWGVSSLVEEQVLEDFQEDPK